MITNKEQSIGCYIPGAEKRKCVTCGRKYYADPNSLQCKPCAEAAIEELGKLEPEERDRRIQLTKDYLSRFIIE